MHILGLDLNDDSLNGTPRRVAKMYVKEVFAGLNPKNRPHARLFENKYNYDQMLVEKDITFYSHCEHHFVPIYGKAHVAYFSNGKVIGFPRSTGLYSILPNAHRYRSGLRFRSVRNRKSTSHGRRWRSDGCKSYMRSFTRCWRYEQQDGHCLFFR